MRPSGTVTRLLNDWRDGDESAFEQILDEVYDELRVLAATHLSHERPGNTLQPTALVHEAYLRLLRGDPDAIGNRTHFFAAAAQAMRRILVEAARRRSAAKRTLPIEMQLHGHSLSTHPGEFLDLDRALNELEQINERHAKVVVLRYFGGLTISETSELMGCSTATLERDWRVARFWLRDRLTTLRSAAAQAEAH